MSAQVSGQVDRGVFRLQTLFRLTTAKRRVEGGTSAAIRNIGRVREPMSCVFHVSAGLVNFRSYGTGLLSNTDPGQTSASVAGIDKVGGHADELAAITVGTFPTAGISAVRVTGVAPAAPPISGTAAAAANRSGDQRMEIENLLDNTV